MGNPKFPQQGSGDPSLNPQQPVYGLLQADFVYQEDVDPGHPLNLDYFIPINCQTVKTARLSFKLRLYRSYSTITLSATGATVLTTDSTGESVTHTHPHSTTHTHSLHVAATGAPANAVFFGSGLNLGDTTNPVPYDTAQVVNASAPGATDANTVDHTHSHNHGAGGHTHPISGTSILGVQEDVNNNPTYTVQFDGVDQTANIIPAGPYSADMIELDVTKFISTKIDRVWHTVSLSPSARGRIQAVLRLLYNSNLV